MQLNMLRSLLKAGITEFGGLTYPITNENLPRVCDTTITNIKRQCPTNLVRMRVIEANHKWVEKFTFGCGGDQEHEREHKNGVLVEFDLPKGKDGKKIEEAALKEPLAKIIVKDGKVANRVVQLVVSHKVLIVPWNEYALVKAEREKREADMEARRVEMRAVAAKLGVTEKGSSKGRSARGTWEFYEDFLYGEDFDEDERKENRDRQKKLQQQIAEADYAFPKVHYNGSPGTTLLYGCVLLPKRHAEKIGAVLEAVRVGDLDAARIAVEKI